MATIWYCTGAEYGVSPLTINGGGLCNVLSGSIAPQSGFKRTGGYAFRINTAAASTAYALNAPASQTVLVFTYYFYFTTLPDGDNFFGVYGYTAAAENIGIMLKSADHKLYARWASGHDGNAANLVIGTGTWYRLDARIDVTSDPNLIDFQVTPVGGSTTVATQSSYVHAASTWSTVKIGQSNARTTDGYLDDIAVSFQTADYPLGALEVIGLSPDTDGTHVGGTNDIEDQAGTDIVTPGYTTAHDLVNSVPMGDTTAYIRQAAGGNNYAELLFADTAQTSIMGAVALLAYRAETATGDKGACTVIDEDATVTTLWGAPGATADYSETSIFYKRVNLPNPSGGWDAAAVNALKSRSGYSDDANPDPWWVDLMVEMAYSTAGGGSVNLAGAVSTLSGALSKQDSKGLAGAVSTLSGGITNQTGRGLAGGVATITGALATAKAWAAALAGGIATITGALTRQAGKGLAGSVSTLSGALTNQAQAGFAGSIATLTGTLDKGILNVRAFAGSIGALSGLLASQAGKGLSGSVATITGVLSSQAQVALAGAVAILTGALTTGMLSIRAFAGSVATITGDLGRQAGKSLAGTIAVLTGSLGKQVGLGAAGSIGASGLLGALKAVLLSVAGALASGGGLGKQAGKETGGTLASGGSVLQNVARGFTGSLASAGGLALQQIFGRLFAGAVGLAGSLSGRVGKVFTGAVAASGQLARAAGKAFAGLLGSTGDLAAVWQGGLKALGAVVVAIERRFAAAFQEQPLALLFLREEQQALLASLEMEAAQRARLTLQEERRTVLVLEESEV